MKIEWDTGWRDDKFFLTFSVESNATISKYCIKCWDDTRNSNETEYIDKLYNWYKKVIQSNGEDLE